MKVKGDVVFWTFLLLSNNIQSVLESTAIEGDSPLEESEYGDFRMSGVVCVGYHA